MPLRYSCTRFTSAWSCGDSGAGFAGASARATAPDPARAAKAAMPASSRRRGKGGDLIILSRDIGARGVGGKTAADSGRNLGGLFDSPRQDLALAHMIGGADHALGFHALDDARGAVVADLQMPL